MVQQVDSYRVPKELLEESMEEEPKTQVEQSKPYRRQIVWFNAIGFLILHLIAVYAFYVAFAHASPLTLMWMIFGMVCGGTGVTMGAHRLYSHKAFKAKPILRFILVTLQTLSGQNCLYIWVRDHRQHHKYSDTDGDPHNSTRGFFFSHIGWLMVRKHPDVISKGKNIDLSDLEADAFVMFQKKYYKTLYLILSIGLPVSVPMWLWGESFINSFLVAYLLRTILSLNLTWMVNSWAHMFGTRPFSKDIAPVESLLVSFFGLGEGWHNYHHTFPWDYKAAELGQSFNLTTTLLDKAAQIGWAYDLRAATPEMVRHRVLKRGDGTHHSLSDISDHERQTILDKYERNANRTPGL